MPNIHDHKILSYTVDLENKRIMFETIYEREALTVYTTIEF